MALNGRGPRKHRNRSLASRWRFSCVACITLAMTSIACGSTGPARYVLATHDAKGAAYNAELSGVLRGVTNNDGTACVYAVSGDGTATMLDWPSGYEATDSPLKVVDASGRPVATIGDRVKLRGALRPDSPRLVGCPQSPRVWLVEGVNTTP